MIRQYSHTADGTIMVLYTQLDYTCVMTFKLMKGGWLSNVPISYESPILSHPLLSQNEPCGFKTNSYVSSIGFTSTYDNNVPSVVPYHYNEHAASLVPLCTEAKRDPFIRIK